jgi:hypothetical protein
MMQRQADSIDCSEFVVLVSPTILSGCSNVEEAATSSSREQPKRERYTRRTAMRWSGVLAQEASMSTHASLSSPRLPRAALTSFASLSAGSVVRRIIAF